MEFIKKYWMYLLGAIGVFVIYRKLNLGKSVNLVNTQYDRVGVTLSEQQVLAYTDNIYNAMKDTGTDVEVLRQIYGILAQNPANTKAVFNAFGYREYSFFGAPVYSWMPSDKVNLKQWIKNELSGELHDKWMSLFDAAGII